MSTNEIVLVDLDLIDPHPNNPRKDLGDLSELAASIKAQGVLQNLTLVPADGGRYRCIIGHRRCAAAKQAGLKCVPAVVREMDEKTQASTMLLENMQRSDLTTFEQAKGIQLAMDLGLTKTEISKKTGFSRATIDRRLNILRYNENDTVAALNRGATLLDFMELNKIKNTKTREELVKQLGTSNFKYSIKQAQDAEKRKERLSEIEKCLQGAAKKINSAVGLQYVKNFVSTNNPDETVADLPTDTELFYTRDSFSIYIYRRPTTEEIKASQEANRAIAERQRKRAPLDEANKTAYELRAGFINSISPKTAAKHADEVMRFAAHEFKIAAEDYRYRKVEIPPQITEPAHMLLWVAYASTQDGIYKNYSNYDCTYKTNPDLDRIYELIIAFGYELSDEERALRDGTHELYVKEN